MKPETKNDLLACETLPTFLVGLRKTLPEENRRQGDVAKMLARHGGPSSKQAVGLFESGKRGLSSAAQFAYVKAFKLDAPMRLHLQRLAGAFRPKAQAA